MRLDARVGQELPPITVYHAEWCRELRRVAWVDDAMPAWGEYAYPLQRDGDHLRVIMRRARRILIMLDKCLVIINPVEDSVPDQAEKCVGRGRTKMRSTG